MGSEITIANAINSIIKQSDSEGVPSRIIHAIKNAASKTGVDFSYLLRKASQESSFDPTAKASTSSATGLFQFTSQTWLQMIKTYGEKYGLSNYASQIMEDSDGHLSVNNISARQAILALRTDPQISAEMAGELDKENAATLQQKIGGKIGATELYLAHFLGAGGACRFIQEMRSNPNTSAADVMPIAAVANQSVFYTKSGEDCSLQQIYEHFAKKFDNSTTETAKITMTSKLSPTRSMETPLSAVSVNQLTMDLASLMPKETAATSQTASFNNSTSDPQLQARFGNMMAAFTGSTTLLDAMIFGQVQNTVLDTTSPLSVLNHLAENRKKETQTEISLAA